MKKILITGGSGFVGRHLLEALLREGANDVTIVDDLSVGPHPEQWEFYPVERDRSDGAITTYRFSKVPGATFRFIPANFAALAGAELGLFPGLGLPSLPPFDEIYHLASIVGGRQMIDGAPLRVGFDLAIDAIFFLWAATVNKPDRILYPSSSAAYPVSLQTDAAEIALTEKMIDFDAGALCPDMTYGWSKLTGEFLARIAVRKHGMKVGVIRPFSGYGEDQDLSYPVPAIALRVAAHEAPVVVWGSGQQGRDFVHIDDCIRGVITACRKIDDGTAVNLGYGKLTSFLELARLLVRLEGYAAEVTGKTGMPVGVANRFCVPDFAAARIGWRAEIPIEVGMRRVLDFAKVRLARSKG